MEIEKARIGWSLAPALTIIVLLAPIAAGVVGTVVPAFGGLRPDGLGALSLDPWRYLLEQPGIAQSVWLSFKTGILSTLAAVGLCFLLIAGWHGTRNFRQIQSLLSPMLAVPHAAAALGLAFLIAPSGWMARLGSPWLTGWSRPPDVLVLQDPGGWSLIAGLVVKELPFLLLMSLAALPQVKSAKRMNVAQALGYGRARGWLLAVMPTLYSQIRLPIYAVLAYAMSNVDVALVLGPSRPPTLSVFVLQWMTDPDLSLRAPAAAAALVQLGLVAVALLVWRLIERGVVWWIARAVQSGVRSAGATDTLLRAVGFWGAALAGFAILCGLLGLLIWSFAGRWRFPDAMPRSFGLKSWGRFGPEVVEVSLTTLGLAFVTAMIALVLVIGCLNAEIRRGQQLNRGGMLILYLPLILPQIAFLPGLQILLLQVGVAKGVLPVIITHLVFVLPYVFLALAGPFRAFDPRFATVAAAMGASETAILWRIRLPMLLAPILTALAVGMSVSVGQYLATLLASGGRVATLTTEALALFSGGDRRAIGVWALALTFAAWLPFVLALATPKLIFRNRQELRHG